MRTNLIRFKPSRLAVGILISLFARHGMAQETYTSSSEPPTPTVVGASQEIASEPPTYEELTDRLKALEGKASTTEKELKKLSEPKPADKPKLPNVIISGVFQADAGAFSQTDESRATYGYIENGAAFRRARLGAKGSVSDRMDYFMQMDFGFFGRPTFTDLWTDFKDVGPFGTVRVGQWKQPFGLESVSSFRYTTFMERSSLFQASYPSVTSELASTTIRMISTGHGPLRISERDRINSVAH